jgi:crotonobetainyl-CoA:carnitine CoA-transferase CaiB-like acyl-CoA transferase
VDGSRGPLTGFRVLDLTVALSGPYCTLLLAGLGAEVIRIESPTGGDIARNNPPFFGPAGFHFGDMGEDDLSVSQLSRGRNKKSISLNLKTGEGRNLFMRLAEKSDVVIENLSEGTADRLGVGYDDVKAVNPEIVYGSILGLGHDSPYPGLKGMDILVQALSGAMDVTGFADGPPVRFGLPIVDLLAPLFLCNGIQAALLQRTRTGKGQYVTASLMGCASSLMPLEHFDVFKRHGFPVRTGNHQTRISPFGLFQTSDGYVAIAAASDLWSGGIFDALGHPEYVRDPRFCGRGPRSQNAHEMNEIIETWTRSLTTEKVLEELHQKRGVPCAPLRHVEDVLSDPWLRRSGAIETLVHPKFGPIDAVGPGVPLTFSDAKVGFDRPAGALGAYNEEIYGGLLQLDAAALKALKEKSVI